jgi:hypothetical protein
MKLALCYLLAAVPLALTVLPFSAVADDGGKGVGDHSSGRSGGAAGSGDAGGDPADASGRPALERVAPTSSAFFPAPIAPGGGDDAEQARELVKHGIIHPLREILQEVRRDAPGDVVGVDLSRQGSRWIYDLKVLTPAGKRVDIAVDAGTMAILPGAP